MRVGVRVGISESPPILIIGQIGDFIHKLMYFPPLQPPPSPYDNLSAKQCHGKPLPCSLNNTAICTSQEDADAIYRLGNYEYAYKSVRWFFLFFSPFSSVVEKLTEMMITDGEWQRTRLFTAL